MNHETVERLMHGEFWPSKTFFKEVRNQVFSIKFSSFVTATTSLTKKTFEYPPLDYLKVSLYRGVDKICRIVGKKDVFAPDNLKTRLQKKRDLKIEKRKMALGEHSDFCIFSKHTAEIVDNLIPRIATQLLFDGLPFVEMQFLYWTGIYFRYCNHKFNQLTNYRSHLNSFIGTIFKRYFTYVGFHVSSNVLDRSNVNPFIDFELIFLNICKSFSSPPNPNKVPAINDIILDSLAKSIHLLNRCDLEIKEECALLSSEEEKLLIRIQWYKEQGALPLGICDPETIALDNSNLLMELDKSLNEFIRVVVKDFIEKKNFMKKKSFPIKFLYWLEGKDFLITIVNFLACEMGIKQIIDPHLLTVAVLSALGVEVADFEIDGFGINKIDEVYTTGKFMLEEYLKGTSSSKIISIFSDSMLKNNTKGVLGIMQKRKAKEKLSKTLFNIIYDSLKPAEFRYESLTKTVKDSMKSIPIIGPAATFLHFTGNAMICSYGYWSSTKNASYLKYMSQNLAGKNLCQDVRDLILELIYHPSIRFVLLTLIDDLHKFLMQPKEVSKKEQELKTEENIKQINTFLINHFMKKFPTGFDSAANYLANDALLKSFKEALKPSDKPITQVLVKTMIPKIKETSLYWKLSDIMKKQSIIFEGDEKFWEVYIRQYLNLVVEKQAAVDGISMSEIEKVTELREKTIDHLLDLSTKLLLEELTALRIHEQETSFKRPSEFPASNDADEKEEGHHSCYIPSIIEDYNPNKNNNF